MVRYLLFFLMALPALNATADPYYLSREEYLRRVRRELKTTLCEASGYLRTCTNLRDDKCYDQVSRVNDLCIAKMKIPEKIDPFDTGLTYGNELGQCVGAKLEQSAKRQPGTLDSVCGHAFR